MNIRKMLEEREKLTLNKYATFSDKNRGREKVDKIDELRTDFMIDRDRIIHSKSFRRLKHKTQVFIKTFGDHYRTRLTHTLEVAQIARTIGRGIGLNEDLIEAIALGHDIGHVAFAHNGEDVLNELMPNGFKHNINSVRILTKIEDNGYGLNLCDEVLNGILYHSGFGKTEAKAYTLEGQVVRLSDKIAYVNHDIDDSLRSGVIKIEDIPKPLCDILGDKHGIRINTLVLNVIENTLKSLDQGKVQVVLSNEINEALLGMREFMFKEVYKGEFLKKERDKAKFVLKQVFEYFLKNPDKLPSFYQGIVEREGLYQGVCDYISGMSDDYCLLLFNDLFVPKFVIY